MTFIRLTQKRHAIWFKLEEVAVIANDERSPGAVLRVAGDYFTVDETVKEVMEIIEGKNEEETDEQDGT